MIESVEDFESFIFLKFNQRNQAKRFNGFIILFGQSLGYLLAATYKAGSTSNEVIFGNEINKDVISSLYNSNLISAIPEKCEDMPALSVLDSYVTEIISKKESKR